MDVASSVNIEPPHTLSPVFGPHSSHPQPRNISSPLPSQYPDSPSIPSSPVPLATEMDSNSSRAATPPPAEESQQSEDSHMENAENSHAESLPNGHVQLPAPSEALTDGSRHQDGEAMDTTPDLAQDEQLPANGVPTPELPNSDTAVIESPPSTVNVGEAPQPQLNSTSTSADHPEIIPNGETADAPDPMDTSTNEEPSNPPNPTPAEANPQVPSSESSAPPPQPPEQPAGLVADSTGLNAPVADDQPASNPPPPPIPADDDNSSDSSEEGNPEDRGVRVEDMTVPSEEELKEIEQAGPEHSAVDHEHWQTKFFPELDDPEYIPGEVGRIDWVVKGVNGTLDKPNNETIMRSPKIRLGGFDWNIKYYPKGNGTDQLSVYIECSKPKAEVPAVEGAAAEATTEAAPAPPAQAEQPASSDAMEVENSDAPNTQPAPVSSVSSGIANSIAGNVALAPPAEEEDDDDDDEDDSEDDDDENVDKSWSIAAQFGVVIYNPTEPRVQYNHGNQHRFDPGAPDWGWTRFHGPHNEIHIRQRGQRAPLLRNDTLAFTAYVRIVNDETKGLWAYQNNPWDSLEKTGLRGLGFEGPGRAYIVASLASWFLLAPFRDVIYKTSLPNPAKEPRSKPKPLITAVQRLLYKLEVQQNPTSPVSLQPFIEAFNWYGLELTSKIDVIEFFEIFRRKLEQELAGTEMEGRLDDLFDGLIERRIKDSEDGMVTDVSGAPLSAGKSPSFSIPVKGMKNVAQALEATLNGNAKIGKAAVSRLPKVLHIELQRQEFDKNTRRWKKLVSKVEIDETINLKPWADEQDVESSYTLYGFIVHTEGLESSLYYPVIRPGGPGTKWFTYMDEKEESKVLCLTRKQAIDLHQGVPADKDAEGTEPVAYILMYVRNDVVGEVLKGIPQEGKPVDWIREEVDFENLSATGKEEARESKEKNSQDTKLPIQIFHPEMFNNHVGLGLLNAYEIADQSENHNVKNVIYIEQTDKMNTIKDVQRELASMIPGIEDMRQCRLWVFKAGLGSTFRPTRLLTDMPYPLSVLRARFPQMRFWLEIVPLADLPTLPIPPPPLPIDPPNLSNTSANIPLLPPSGAIAQSPVTPLFPAATEPQENIVNTETPVEASAPVPAGNTVTPAENVEAEVEPAADVVMQTDDVVAPAPAPTQTSEPAAPQEPSNNDEMDAEPTTPEPVVDATAEPEVVTEPTPDAAREVAPEVAPEVVPVTTATETAAENAPEVVPEIVAEPVQETAAETAPEVAPATVTQTAMQAMETALALEAVHEAAMEAFVTAQEAVESVMELMPTPLPELPAQVENTATSLDSVANETVPVVALVPDPIPPPVLAPEADVLMGGVESISTIEPPPPPPVAAFIPPPPVSFNSTPPPPPALDWNAILDGPAFSTPTVHYFLKRFDVKEQMLVSLGSFYAKHNEKVDSAVRKALKLDNDKYFLLWEEVSISSVKPINLGRSFDHENLNNGPIIVIQDKLNEKEYIIPSGTKRRKLLTWTSTATIEENGNFATLPGYVRFLLDRANHPETLNGFISRNYFSGERFSGQIKNGRKHGFGSYTYTNGDTYEGYFIADRRQGKGTMTFQNRDTYTGDWRNDVMDGEGKFVYHKTGNIYTGGFRMGRRHGRGTMEYQVADEEQSLCQICYEGEMDCLFYDCGHVCACMDCAKQVEICPVCRKSIISVVKIFRTL